MKKFIRKESKGLEFTINKDGKSYSVTSIGKCTDTNIIIPSKHKGLPVTSIRDSAFAWCKSLTNITIPYGVTSIGVWAFAWCKSLTNITIPNSVTSIGGGVFYRCESLKSITIPDSVTSIRIDAFSYCTSLTSITIPDSVTSIGYFAFFGCTSLTSIVYKGTIEQWNKITFGFNWDVVTPNYTIHCTDGTITKNKMEEK